MNAHPAHDDAEDIQKPAAHRDSKNSQKNPGGLLDLAVRAEELSGTRTPGQHDPEIERILTDYFSSQTREERRSNKKRKQNEQRLREEDREIKRRFAESLGPGYLSIIGSLCADVLMGKVARAKHRGRRQLTIEEVADEVLDLLERLHLKQVSWFLHDRPLNQFGLTSGEIEAALLIDKDHAGPPANIESLLPGSLAFLVKKGRVTERMIEGFKRYAPAAPRRVNQGKMAARGL